MLGIVSVLGAIGPALSSSVFRNLRVAGYSLFGFWDAIVVNGLMPVGVLMFCLAVSRRIKAEKMIAEFVNDDSLVTQKLYSHWRMVVTVVIPALIVVCLAPALIGFFLH